MAEFDVNRVQAVREETGVRIATVNNIFRLLESEELWDSGYLESKVYHDNPVMAAIRLIQVAQNGLALDLREYGELVVASHVDEAFRWAYLMRPKYKTDGRAVVTMNKPLIDIFLVVEWALRILRIVGYDTGGLTEVF